MKIESNRKLFELSPKTILKHEMCFLHFKLLYILLFVKKIEQEGKPGPSGESVSVGRERIKGKSMGG
jgi:hypothetical protein